MSKEAVKSHPGRGRFSLPVITGTAVGLVIFIAAGEAVGRMLEESGFASVHRAYPLVRIVVTSLLTALLAVYLSTRFKGEERRTAGDTATGGAEAEGESERVLGKMASVVAHEIKNPITGISCAAELLMSKSSKKSGDREVFEELLKLVARLNKIVCDLTEYAKPKSPEPIISELGPLIEKALARVQKENPVSGIEIETGSKGPIGPVEIDPELMERAFFHTILNAFQAMDGKGKLGITTEADGGKASVSFSDTGKGIPDEDRDHVFEPFFSTKHRGTGLGLAIVKRTIDAHRGEVRVKTEAGKGSTFTLTFPSGPAADSPKDTT